MSLTLVVALGHLAIAGVVGPHAWDDGAITMAFSRTFGDTGHIALTPSSETVEGFSSPLWFLILALTHRVLGLGFLEMITAAQIWSAACAAASAVLAFRLASRRIALPVAWVVSAALFLSGPYLNETMNGMEMGGLTLVVLVIATLLDDGRYGPLLFAVSFLGPLVRLEAAGYLAVSAAGILLLSRSTKAAAAVGGGALASLAVQTVTRLIVFDAWLPNSIAAKRWPPYTSRSLTDRLSASVEAVLETLVLLGPTLMFALAAVAIMHLRSKRARGSRTRATTDEQARPTPAVAFMLCYVLGVVAFNTLIGKNWGYRGRMELSAAAPFLLLVVGVVMTRRAPARAVLATATVVLVASTAAMSMLTLQWTNIRLATQGTEGAVASDQITPANYRKTGVAVDEVRVLLGEEVLAYMTPDVGGSSLCCSRLQILDAGLLANRELAKQGYERFDSYLTSVSPDIIEMHSPWSNVSGIYDSAYFRSTYAPVISNDTWLYIRRDRMSVLAPHCEYVPIESTASMRYRGVESDEEYVASRAWTRICVIH